MNLQYIFHKQYYEAQVGNSFVNKKSALDHFHRYGMKRGISPNPLISFEYLPEEVRKSYLRSEVSGFINFLSSKKSLDQPLGPFLDFKNQDLIAETQTALDYLIKIKKNTLIQPSRSSTATEPVTYQSAAEVMIAATSEVVSQRRLQGESMSKHWDEELEAAWLADLQHRAHLLDEQLISTDPIVSIVMPVWNRPETVLVAIESVQNQSLKEWELIIVDDGSTDNTVDVIKAAMESDGRIRLVEAAHGGVCAARNSGIDVSRGKYVAFLDSDNTWRSEFLRNIIIEMVSKDLECAFSAIRIEDGIHGTRYLGTDFVAEQLLIRNYVDMNTIVVSRDVLDQISGFDTTLRRMVDHDLVIRISNVAEIKFLPFIGCDYYNEDSGDRISTSESENWMYAVFGKNLVDWQILRKNVGKREKNLVSFIVPMFHNHNAVLKTVGSLMSTVTETEFEIIIVDNDSKSSSSVNVRASTHGNSRVKIIRQRRNYGFSIAANIGFAESRGDRVVFMQPGIRFREGWASALLNELDDPEVIACQPLVMEPNGTICNAGYVYPTASSLPVFFLNGLPIQDAGNGGALTISGVTSNVLAVAAIDFADVGGFDPLLIQGLEDADLSLRLSVRDARKIRCVTDSYAVRDNACAPAKKIKSWVDDVEIFRNRWMHDIEPDIDAAVSQVTMKVDHLVPGRVDAAIRDSVAWCRKTSPAEVDLKTGYRSLRWAIKIGALYTEGQDKWGDVFFADDLAKALRKLGQEVVIDRADAFDRDTAYLDDVTLTIRGFKPFRPQAGRVNLLWVISRPDDVSPKEIAFFDHVYAASKVWADSMSKRSNIGVETLLQATNPERFHPESAGGESTDALVFVGGPRPPIGRKIIADCMEAGIPVAAWGPRWEQFVPADMIKGDFLDNHLTSGTYRGARLLLNDHFDDMGSNGFINNRIYDAVASGARVLSDDVEGISEIFGSAVQVYRSREDLIRLAGSDGLKYFASDEELTEISSRIRTQHSFDARAKTLVERALSKFYDRR